MAYGVQTTYRNGTRITVPYGSYEDARRECLVRLGCWVHNPCIMDIRIVIWESELTDCVRTL